MITLKKQPDIEVKMMRQKRIRKQNPPSSLPIKSATIPIANAALSTATSSNMPSMQLHPAVDLSHFNTKKRTTAKQLLKHLKQNRDRIRYDSGELQFDGIKAGDSNIDELVGAFVGDTQPKNTKGWKTLMNALEGTEASPSLYAKWKKHNKGDWRSLKSWRNAQKTLSDTLD